MRRNKKKTKENQTNSPYLHSHAFLHSSRNSGVSQIVREKHFNMHQPYDPFNFLPNHGQVGDVSRTPQAGEIISLMTTSLIRYEGYLLGINSEMMTVGMCTVRSFGTENRPCASPIPPQKDTYDYLLFRCDRVMTMSVIQDFTPIAGLNRFVWFYYLFDPDAYIIVGGALWGIITLLVAIQKWRRIAFLISNTATI